MGAQYTHGLLRHTLRELSRLLRGVRGMKKAYYLFYLPGSHATGSPKQEIFSNTQSFADTSLVIINGRTFTPSVDLFLHILQVVFFAF